MARQVEVNLILLANPQNSLNEISNDLRIAIEDELGWDVDDLQIKNLDE